MRKLFSKFALVAVFGLALTFTFSCSSDDGGDKNSTSDSSSSRGGSSGGSSSSAIAPIEFVAPATRIDRFASDNLREQLTGIIAGEWWFNYVSGKATIDNSILDFSVEPDTLKAMAPMFDGEKYIQLKNIKLPKMDWSDPNYEWGGTGMGFELLGNGSKYDLAKCNDGFKYSYKGNAHSFRIEFKKNGKSVEYIKDFNDVSDWTTVTLAPSDIKRDQNDELNCYGNTDTPCTTKDTNIPLNLSVIKQIQWQVRPSESKAIAGNLQMKDLYCLAH